MESTDLAIYSHEKRFILVSEKIEVKVYRWNLNINATISRMFQKGWIEVRGLPFHLWSEKYLFHLVEGWGKVIKIDKQTLKLVYLTKIRLKVEVKENVVIPVIVRVSNGDRPFQTGNVELNRGGCSIFDGCVNYEGLEKDWRADRLPRFKPHGVCWEKVEDSSIPCHARQFSNFKSTNSCEKDSDCSLHCSGPFNQLGRSSKQVVLKGQQAHLFEGSPRYRLGHNNLGD